MNILWWMGLAYFVFLIWVTVDAWKRLKRNVGMKWIWLMLIWGTGVGAIVYFFIKKKIR